MPVISLLGLFCGDFAAHPSIAPVPALVNPVAEDIEVQAEAMVRVGPHPVIA